MSSQFTSYYLQSLKSKVGLHTARKESNRMSTQSDNRKVYGGSDPSLAMSMSKEARGCNKSASGPIYTMLPDLMKEIREPKAVPVSKRLSYSNNKRGISRRRRSDTIGHDDELRAINQKMAPSCNSKSSFRLTSNHLDMDTSRKYVDTSNRKSNQYECIGKTAEYKIVNDRGDCNHQIPNQIKFTVSDARDHDQMMNPGYKDLIKQQSSVAEELARANRRKSIDDSFLYYRNKIEMLDSKKQSTSAREMPLRSPRSTRNTISLRKIKRGKIYGPEAIAAVSGFGITQYIIMDGTDSYTYLQSPSSKNSSTTDKASKKTMSHPPPHDMTQVSTTTPSPIDKYLWTIDNVNASKPGHVNRRNAEGFHAEEDENESEMPMPTARKMFYQAVNIHELNRTRNNLSKLTINSNSPIFKNVINKTNSEIQVPLHVDAGIVHKKVPATFSVPSMPAYLSSSRESDQPSQRQVYPTKLQLNAFVNELNVGGGDKTDIENIVVGKLNKKKASKPQSQSSVARKIIRSKRKRSARCKKQTRTRSSKRDGFLLKSPKIKGINFNDFNYTPESNEFDPGLKSIRTVVLPFPMAKYKHTI